VTTLEGPIYRVAVPPESAPRRRRRGRRARHDATRERAGAVDGRRVGRRIGRGGGGSMGIAVIDRAFGVDDVASPLAHSLAATSLAFGPLERRVYVVGLRHVHDGDLASRSNPSSSRRLQAPSNLGRAARLRRAETNKLFGGVLGRAPRARRPNARSRPRRLRDQRPRIGRGVLRARVAVRRQALRVRDDGGRRSARAHRVRPGVEDFRRGPRRRASRRDGQSEQRRLRRREYLPRPRCVDGALVGRSRTSFIGDDGLDRRGDQQPAMGDVLPRRLLGFRQ
jgi:hypothetical protein